MKKKRAQENAKVDSLEFDLNMIDIIILLVRCVCDCSYSCQLPYPNYGHIILVSPSPILFYPISSTETRCFVGVPGQHLPSISNGELSRYMITAVAPKVLII